MAGETYPELRLNLKRSLDVIEKEYNSFLQLKMQTNSDWEKLLLSHPELRDLPNDNPGLVQAVNEVKVSPNFSINILLKQYSKLSGLKRDLWECCLQLARQSWIGFRVDQ